MNTRIAQQSDQMDPRSIRLSLRKRTIQDIVVHKLARRHGISYSRSLGLGHPSTSDVQMADLCIAGFIVFLAYAGARRGKYGRRIVAAYLVIKWRMCDRYG